MSRVSVGALEEVNVNCGHGIIFEANFEAT